MNEKRLLSVCLLVALVILMVAAGLARGSGQLEKRGNAKSFYISRYGRGGAKQDKNPNVSARNDKQFEKFFIGSRYGKRAGDFTEMATDDDLTGLPAAASEFGMTCLYTGITNLYRCSERKEILTKNLNNLETVE